MRDTHDTIKELEKYFQMDNFLGKLDLEKREKNSLQPTAKFMRKKFFKILNRDFCFSMKFEHASYLRAKNTSYVNDFVKTSILILSK